MSLLPDPGALEAVAGRIDAHATLIRTRAHRIGLAVGATTWHGGAARAFAATAIEVCTALRRNAERLDDAAAALRRHAASIRDTLDDLSRLGDDLAGLVGDTGNLLGDSLLHPGRLLGDGTGLLVGAGHLGGDALDLIGL